MKSVSESKKEVGEHATAEIEVTNCPDCGTEWEVVVTARTQDASERKQREG